MVMRGKYADTKLVCSQSSSNVEPKCVERLTSSLRRVLIHPFLSFSKNIKHLAHLSLHSQSEDCKWFGAVHMSLRLKRYSSALPLPTLEVFLLQRLYSPTRPSSVLSLTIPSPLVSSRSPLLFQCRSHHVRTWPMTGVFSSRHDSILFRCALSQPARQEYSQDVLLQTLVA